MIKRCRQSPSSCCTSRSGFTLLEMMVALTIFALLGLASYRLLYSATIQQQAVQQQQAQQAKVAAVLLQLRQELANALNRPLHSNGRERQPAFIGDQLSMAWTTRLPTAANHWPYWEVVGVRYKFIPGPRGGFDRGRWTPPGRDEKSMLENSHRMVASEGWLRYRDARAQWHSQWPPLHSQRSWQPLPSAVELTVRGTVYGSWTQIYNVAATTLDERRQ